jgi:hypothetical protein
MSVEVRKVKPTGSVWGCWVDGVLVSTSSRDGIVVHANQQLAARGEVQS